MRAGMFFGILGVLVSVSAAAFALLDAVAHGAHGRAGFGFAAFVFALLIGVGASLLPARVEIGAALMVASSIAGTLAVNVLSANSWYAFAVPLCVLGAFLALWAARPTPAIVALRWVTLTLLAMGVIVGYIFGGLFGALAFVIPLLIAAFLVLIGSASTSPSPRA
jgi:hypothetical protein